MAEINLSGTHKRELDGLPAFGNKFHSFRAIIIDFTVDSKIKEFREANNSSTIDRQLHIMRLR